MCGSRAAFVNADPTGEHPRSDEARDPRKQKRPHDPGGAAFPKARIERAPDGVEREAMQRGDDDEPRERPPVMPQKFAVIAQRGGEGFAVKDERDLHGRGEQREGGEREAREGEAVREGFLLGEPSGERREVSQHERRVDEDRAEHHDDARPFHHGAETADRKIDERIVSVWQYILRFQA